MSPFASIRVGFCVTFAFLLSSCAVLPPSAPYKLSETSRPSTGYRGVVHVHTAFSHDSLVELKEVIEAAQDADLDFVVITDHNNMNGRAAYAAMSAADKPPIPLLIFGTEYSAPDGHLVLLGLNEMPPYDIPSQNVVNWVHEKGGKVIVAHPVSLKNPWKAGSVTGFDGMEVYNFSHEFYAENKASLVMKLTALLPKHFLKRFQDRPVDALALWDEKLKSGPMAGLAGVDAHVKWQRLGLSLLHLPNQFRAVTLYVYPERFTESRIIEALVRGRSYIAFEALGVADRFSLRVDTGGKTYGPGHTAPAGQPLKFNIYTGYKKSMVRLLRNGSEVAAARGELVQFKTEGAGVYRVEVDRSGKLWIIANPVYVK